jgi:hypothetical protein
MGRPTDATWFGKSADTGITYHRQSLLMVDGYRSKWLMQDDMYVTNGGIMEYGDSRRPRQRLNVSRRTHQPPR